MAFWKRKPIAHPIKAERTVSATTDRRLKNESTTKDSENYGNASSSVENTKKCPYCAETIRAGALICRYCGKNLRVSPSSFSGTPESKTKGKGCGTILLGVIGLILILFLASIFGSTDGREGGSLHDEVGAWIVCQKFVKQALKAPATADFPSGHDQFTKHLGGGKYQVNAYVDAENSFSAKIRSRFTCIVQQQGQRDNYKLVDLQFAE